MMVKEVLRNSQAEILIMVSLRGVLCRSNLLPDMQEIAAAEIGIASLRSQ